MYNNTIHRLSMGLKKKLGCPCLRWLGGVSVADHSLCASCRRPTQHARTPEKEENEGSLESGLSLAGRRE